MGLRSKLATALLACALLPSCRFHMDAIRTGGSWQVEQYGDIELGVDGRGEVLALLGPPDEVFYTLSEEVFLYRMGLHRGSEFRLLVPDVFINPGRPGLQALSPDSSEPTALAAETPIVSFLRGLTENLTGFAAPVTGDQALSLLNRQVRFDVIRVVLDRETHVTLSKELIRNVGADDLSSFVGETLLLSGDG
ncbi:MAG: hypothetical protein AAF682_17405 [Planctomycetota bacterium]